MRAEDVAACWAAVAPYLCNYVWQKDAFYLCDDAQQRCPWVNHTSALESKGRLLWAQMHHEGNPCDMWFAVFLLSCITTAVPGAVARIQDEHGSDVLVTEAADYIPNWLDSSKYGTLETIAMNRIWVAAGNLHIIPIKGDTGLPAPITSLAAALEAVRDPARSTAAPARVQEHLKRQHLQRYPDAATKAMHAARFMLPERAASVLLAEPQLVALAVGAFEHRDPDDMRAAAAHAFFPQRDERLCVLRLNRNHYAALSQSPFSVPPTWSIPPLKHPTHNAASLGLKLCIGLEIVAHRCGVQLSKAQMSSSVKSDSVAVCLKTSFCLLISFLCSYITISSSMEKLQH